jgi:glycosyltransferase involved in cell wall biosynthesis
MGRQSATPLVSIITPAYNREEYLPQTIESVLAQGFSDWEMIIVDDGSTTNGNRLIAGGYCARDPRIRYYHQQHGGPSSARNLAISHARGSLLAFLDSDDRYLKNGLATLVQALQKAPPRVKLVYGDFVKFFQSENRFQPTRARPPLPRPGLYF